MWRVGSSSLVGLVIKGDRISKHEDPIHGDEGGMSRTVCPTRGSCPHRQIQSKQMKSRRRTRA